MPPYRGRNLALFPAPLSAGSSKAAPPHPDPAGLPGSAVSTPGRLQPLPLVLPRPWVCRTAGLRPGNELFSELRKKGLVLPANAESQKGELVSSFLPFRFLSFSLSSALCENSSPVSNQGKSWQAPNMCSHSRTKRSVCWCVQGKSCSLQLAEVFPCCSDSRPSVCSACWPSQSRAGCWEPSCGELGPREGAAPQRSALSPQGALGAVPSTGTSSPVLALLRLGVPLAGARVCSLPPSAPPVLRLLSGRWRRALRRSQASSPAPGGHTGLSSLCGCRLVGFISEQDLTPVRPYPPRLPCRCSAEARAPRVSCGPTLVGS